MYSDWPAPFQKAIEKGREEQWKSNPFVTSLLWGFAALENGNEKSSRKDTKPRNKILLHICLAARSVRQKINQEKDVSLIDKERRYKVWGR